jgi:CRP/FNR family transcriptional regulator, cyclic AMP receptor protein
LSDSGICIRHGPASILYIAALIDYVICPAMTSQGIDAKTLKRLPLFSALTAAQLTWALATVRRRTYAARAHILKAGEIADGLYWVLSGSARIVYEDGDGRELIANVVGSNDFFGEMGLLDGAASAANVHAAEPCEILHVPRRVILECIEDNAAAALALLRTALGRLCSAHAKMGNLALVNVYGRVAQVLLEHGRETDGEWCLDLAAGEIAALVGASREMVSRVLRSMIQRGVVRRVRRRLIVTDRPALLHATPREL